MVGRNGNRKKQDQQPDKCTPSETPISFEHTRVRWNTGRVIIHTKNVIQAIRSNIKVHDIDIRRWALQAKLEEDLASFTAGRTWLLKFKKAYGIVSQKVTKFVTRPNIDKEPELISSSHNFLERVKSYTDRYGFENLYNSDQSDFNLELHSGRTLALKGNIWRVWT
ncbi:uncharacterized protein LOC114881549 isoform X2 [Osmia bicornis bicornis]|uniref:uncharacterized protein LOC114881549 isoform X2 n=1 Tax=Osmia bicornis bicornis TaxID=1437191 RepID=UPI001EAF72DB|nr:uncharacterized protein LOC114881549 isoform X2 [Osmia bicornis bicornis]